MPSRNIQISMLIGLMIIILPMQKNTDNTSGYFILDRIRGLYHWVIDQSKLDLRRKYIHDDKEYKKNSR